MKQTNQILRCTLITFFTLAFFSCEQEENTTNFLSNQEKENFVTQEKAIEISSSLVFDKIAKNTNSSIKKNIFSISPITDGNNEPIFYVINYQEGGFVLLAADNRYEPILSYSDDGYFDTNKETQPDGLIYWQNSITKDIQYVRENNIYQTAEIKYKWEHINLSNFAGKEPPGGGCVPELEVVNPLLSTIWDQECGYNSALPLSSCTPSSLCGHVYAGCVPIAMAQVMKYHQYPTSYNWSNMPNNYGTNTTAQFIKDIHSAFSTNIHYYCTDTGVDQTYDISALIRNSFGYSSAGQNFYNSTTVKNNLRANKPVILAGGGHAWVADGFKNGKVCLEGGGAEWYLLFHMNWGWDNGDFNGWYSYNNFNPNGNNFNSDVQMVFNINP